MFVKLYTCVFLGLIFSFSAFRQIIEFRTKLLIFNLFTILFRYGSVVNCGSLKRKTHDNPSGSSVVENSASAQKITQILSILFANGIFHSE
jgi:hypothetical protein